MIANTSSEGGVCYTAHSSANVSWSSANTECVQNGNSRIARALNDEMSDEIERVTQDSNEYWIGLSRVDNSSEFMWYDGSSVSSMDTRWSSGHPKDGLNCVSVRGDGIKWYSSNCNEDKHYVCEKG